MSWYLASFAGCSSGSRHPSCMGAEVRMVACARLSEITRVGIARPLTYTFTPAAWPEPSYVKKMCFQAPSSGRNVTEITHIATSRVAFLGGSGECFLALASAASFALFFFAASSSAFFWIAGLLADRSFLLRSYGEG